MLRKEVGELRPVGNLQDYLAKGPYRRQFTPPDDPHLEHIFGKLGISSRVQLATGLSPTAPSPERPPPPPGPPGP